MNTFRFSKTLEYLAIVGYTKRVHISSIRTRNLRLDVLELENI